MESVTSTLTTGEALKAFQLTTDQQAKSSVEYGRAIAQYIESTLGGNNGYYYNRNARFKANRDLADGRIDVYKRFADRLRFDGKVNYANMKWKCIMICHTIVSRLVGRWMDRAEKIDVTAIDALSVKDKLKEYNSAEFYLHNKSLVENLNTKSGVIQTSPDQFIPEDKDELEVWKKELLRLPEEILYQEGCNDILDAHGWYDIVKERLLQESAKIALLGAEVTMDENGIINLDVINGENCIYSNSEYPDFRDTTWRGRIKSGKISEIRKKYGAEFNNGKGLSEAELWDIAQLCKEYSLIDKLVWQDQWLSAVMRPYDEWNVEVVVFEIKTVDSEKLTEILTKETKTVLLKKGAPDKLKSNEQIIEDQNINIYRGVYIRKPVKLLEWGIKTNMIRPQDPKESGNAEFSFSFFMGNQCNMRNIAIPEKLEEPIDNMILARLKMQQVIATSRPPGAAINESALNEIDYGLGEKNKEVDAKKHFDQTGDLYYRGVDAEGNPLPVPITELQNAGFLTQMQGLMENYKFNYEILKDELGEDPNLISRAATPRVSVQGIQDSERMGEYATDSYYNSYMYLLTDVAKKISCLLKTSVENGSKAYRAIMNEGDVKGRIFTTKIKALPTDQQIADLKAMMAEWLKSTPDVIMYIDPFKLERLAKEDVKLAELYYQHSMKKMLRSKAQEQQQVMKANSDAQLASLQEKGKQDAELKSIDIQKAQETNAGQHRNTVLSSIMKMYETGVTIPAELQRVAEAVIQNVAIPAIVQNEQQKNEIIAAMQQQAVQQQQPQSQPPVDQQQDQDQNIPAGQSDQQSSAYAA